MIDELKKLIHMMFFSICCCLIIAVGVAILLRTPLLGGMKAYLFQLFVFDCICTVLLLVLVIVLSIKRKQIFWLNFSSMVISIVFSAVFMALFFSLGPMTIERSYTVFTLADLSDNAGKVYTSQEIKDNFEDRFIEEFNESQRRIEEQVSIGNVEEVDGGYQITKKGERLIKLFRFIETIFPVPVEHSIYPNGH